MSFQNDDLLLINRSGTSFKTEYGLLRERIIEGIGGATVSETEPTGEHEGDLWYQPSTDSLFVWVVTNTTGVVTSVTVRNGGSGYVTNETNVATIGGDGEGLTLDIQAGAGGNFASPTVNQGGSGYKVSNVVYLSGAGNQNGSATVTAVNEVPTGAWEAVDSGIEEAPNDGQQYARQNEAWSVVGGGAAIEYSGAASWGTLNSNGNKEAAGLNFASSVRTGTGAYTVTFENPMPNNQYSVQALASTGSAPHGVMIAATRPEGFDIITFNTGTGATTDSATSFAVHATNATPPRGGTGADAWVVGGSDGSIVSSFNIATVDRITTGTYSVRLQTSMPTADYAVVVSTVGAGNREWGVDQRTNNGFRLYCYKNGALDDVGFSAVVHATNAQLPFTVTQSQIETAVSAAELVDTLSQTIQQLEGRIQQLEADHAQMMGNNNGGY